MTPHEKYGLASDVKSIRERIEKDEYAKHAWEKRGQPSFGIYREHDVESVTREANEQRSADLALLCELAEKGERYEKAVKEKRAELAKTYAIVCETEIQKALAKTIDNVLDGIITEAEGEGK